MKKSLNEKPVVVTGANGYVAGWVVKLLVDEGFTVHATVRDPDNEDKTSYLAALAQDAPGNIRFFRADLLNPGSFSEAMEGCEVVFHTASPFTTEVSDPKKELVEPAVEGTHNVLEEAIRNPEVKRVVVTSSCAAIYTDCIDLEATPNGVFTEDIWNTTASLDHQPYSWSKTLAEEEAWKIAGEQQQWKLVVVNPSMVLGPSLNPAANTSESFKLLTQMADGSLKMGVPDIGVGIVDVRDLARAHLQAGFIEEAEGRHIINGHNSSFYQVARILHSQYGDRFPIPKSKVPKWLLMLVGPTINKALTRKYIRNNVGKAWKASNRKSREKLGMTYRPLEETLHDSFEALVDAGLVNA